MARVVLIAGGNLGPVRENLEKARERIGREVGAIVAASLVRESAPWGFEAPEPFLNQVLVAETGLSPEAVLEKTREIERELGRERNGITGYASRTMDIDILFYDDRVIDTPTLTVPHPLMTRRTFVLEPLCEVMPDYRHPALGRTVGELLDDLRNEPKTTRNEKESKNDETNRDFSADFGGDTGGGRVQKSDDVAQLSPHGVGAAGK